MLFTLLLSIALQPFALADTDAQKFERIFLQQVKAAKGSATNQQVRDTFLQPDASLQEANQASSIEQAMGKGNASTLSKMAAATGNSLPAGAGDSSGAEMPTMVIVPGVFAEFIKTRAFEEIFEKPSKTKNDFIDKVQEAREKGSADASDSVSLLKNYQQGKTRKDFETKVDLEDVLHVGETEVNGKKVKVVLLGTPFGSLESLGDGKERAAIFNRRLEKYMAVTGQQNIALVGYSRGTVLGLEMLAQAKAANKPWVKNVKGMVSLGGVVWGSCLADDAMTNPDSPTHKLVQDLMGTINGMELIPEGASVAEAARIALANKARIAAFAARAGAAKVEEAAGSPFSVPSSADLRSLVNVDPTSIAGMTIALAQDLGIEHPVTDYNKNIERFRYFVGELMASMKELSSEARQEWWKKRDVPTSLTYYSMPGAMANPDAPRAERAMEKRMFENPLSYGSGSFDDVSLLGNRKTYEKLCGSKTNDSQVSVVQASFLPKVVKELNPKNAGIKTKFLGVAGTHHWGLALREVNRMQGGERNGFPREALLQALAQQIANDMKPGAIEGGDAPGQSNSAE